MHALSPQVVAGLAAVQNEDGGWGYGAGKGSRVEATSWIILGLLVTDLPGARAAAERGLDWLVRVQGADGNYFSAPDFPLSEWTTAPAVLALNAGKRPRDAAALEKACRALIAQHSQTQKPRGADESKSMLIGWGWTTNAFSWIEPNCGGVMALRAAWPASYTVNDPAWVRIEQARQIILTRRCKDGGWNHGSTGSDGFQLSSFPMPTAEALTALQGMDDEASLNRGRERLRAVIALEPSLLSCAWATIAMRLAGQAGWDEEIAARLDRFPEQANWGQGLALLAWNGPKKVLPTKPWAAPAS